MMAYLNNIRKMAAYKGDMLLRQLTGSILRSSWQKDVLARAQGQSALAGRAALARVHASCRKNLVDILVGVLVQTNFGGVLQMDGIPVGKELGQYYLKEHLDDTIG